MSVGRQERAKLYWAAIILGCVLVLGLSVRTYFETRRSRERGRLVVSIVKEQLHALSDANVDEQSLMRSAGWPDDFLNLETWLIVESTREQKPEIIGRRLNEVVGSHPISPVLKKSVSRWEEALMRWSRSPEKGMTLSAKELFHEGRQRYYEASGYQRIGRQYDAAALYLWGASYLETFIEKAPWDPAVAEALYLLGESFMRLRHAIPMKIRSDRILNLCSELYPDSIWARRADEVWRSEMGNGI